MYMLWMLLWTLHTLDTDLVHWNMWLCLKYTSFWKSLLDHPNFQANAAVLLHSMAFGWLAEGPWVQVEMKKVVGEWNIHGILVDYEWNLGINMYAATLTLRRVWLQVDMKIKFTLLLQSTGHVQLVVQVPGARVVVTWIAKSSSLWQFHLALPLGSIIHT